MPVSLQDHVFRQPLIPQDDNRDAHRRRRRSVIQNFQSAFAALLNVREELLIRVGEWSSGSPKNTARVETGRSQSKWKLKVHL